MKCPKCGKEIADESMFCEFCGTKIKRNKVAVPTNWLKNKGLWPIYVAVIAIIVLLCVSLNTDKCVKGIENGYEYVDLGLSVKWATCNQGAIKPQDFGACFSWGETFSLPDITKIDKIVDEIDHTLLLSHDAAKCSRGGGWRTPTRAEFSELIANCFVDACTLKGVWGYKFTSTKPGFEKQWIFLPGNARSDYMCNYWTSSLCYADSDMPLSYCVRGDSNRGDKIRIIPIPCELETAIRPVCSSNGALCGQGAGGGVLLILIDALFIIIYSIIYFVKTRKKRQAE